MARGDLRARARVGHRRFSTPFDDNIGGLSRAPPGALLQDRLFLNTDLPLIRRVAATAKPVILSTGMPQPAELDRGSDGGAQAGCKDLVLLNATSHLSRHAREHECRPDPAHAGVFGCQVGLSDHTMGVGVAVAAVGAGRDRIEKHFRCHAPMAGSTARSAGTVEDASLVTETRERGRPWAVSRTPIEAERKSLHLRRSLYVVEDVAAGEALSPATCGPFGRVWPATRYLEHVIGRTVGGGRSSAGRRWVELFEGSALRIGFASVYVGAPCRA